jgi:peptidylprolyl isomerase
MQLRKRQYGTVRTRRWAAAGLMLALIGPAPAAATEIGAAEEVVRNVYGTSITRRMQVGERLVADQKVTTQVQSAATLKLADDTRLAMGPSSQVVLDEFVYQPEKSLASGAINMAKGLMRFTSAGARMDLKVRTPAATIGIRGTIFDVMVSRDGTEVAVRDGAVQVDSKSGSQRVEAGQAIVVPSDGGRATLGRPSLTIARALRQMAALMPSSAEIRKHKPKPKSPPEVQQATKVDAARAKVPPELLEGRDPETLVLLKLPTGLVAIQLRPDLAPQHAAWFKELVRQDYYDGVTFHSIVEGFAAETGDPSGTGNGGVEKPLPPEFADAGFVRGSVGMKPKLGDDGTATSQFFILMRDAPHLNGKYTHIGEVVYGLELIGRMRGGQPPRNPVPIVSLLLAADLER